MKSDRQSWAEYINEARYNTNIDKMMLSMYDMRIEKLHDKLDQLRLAYKDIHEMSYGSVKERGSPVVIIKYTLSNFIGREKYGTYGFRAQCLLTGDQSKPIKVDEYPKYGIIQDWQDSGGPYTEKWDIPNVIKPILNHYYTLSSTIYKAIQNVQTKYITDVTSIINIEWKHRYSQYLYSYEWKQLRLTVINNDLNKCLNCKSHTSLQVHHITYENVGNEPLEDLLTLCSTCHKNIHQIDYNDRLEIERICTEQRQLNKEL